METLFLDHIDRMTYSEGNLMKMDIRDSLDNGQRMMKFLGQQKRNWEDGRYTDLITTLQLFLSFWINRFPPPDPCIKIVGGVGTPDFFKHLVNSLVFQNNLFANGRCEFLLFVTPSVLLVITDLKCLNSVRLLNPPFPPGISALHLQRAGGLLLLSTARRPLPAAVRVRDPGAVAAQRLSALGERAQEELEVVAPQRDPPRASVPRAHRAAS